MQHTKGKYRRVIVSLVAIPALLALALPAYAPTSTNNMSVSCDGATILSGTTVAHDPAGTFKIKQNSANPASNTWVSARSANGNDLSFKFVSNGATATWTSVLANSYTVRAYRSGSYNCNGWLPGYGNFTLNYTVTFN